MLHMGYIDEVLFGKEVVDEMPRVVKGWVEALETRGETLKTNSSKMMAFHFASAEEVPGAAR